MSVTTTPSRTWVAVSTLRRHYTRRVIEDGKIVDVSAKGRLTEGEWVYNNDKCFELFLYDYVNGRFLIEEITS